MVRNADSIENAIGPKWPGGQYAHGFGGAVEPQRSPSAQSVMCGRRGSGSTDTPIRQYVWGTYIDECIQLTTLAVLGAQNLAAGSYYLLQDLLYRAVALTNSGGYIVEAYDTDAYGNTLIFIEPGSDGRWFTDDDVQSDYGANEIIYCGYRFDSETQLYYVRNRTYNPVLGRWLQRDPIGYSGGINLYEYVGGWPLTISDWLGLSWWWPWGGPSVPKPTGNPSIDAATFWSLVRSKGLATAIQFLKAASKSYATQGLSEALDQAISRLRGIGTDAGTARALAAAEDVIASDLVSKLGAGAGAVLQQIVGLLKGLSSKPRINLLQTIRKALEAAQKGDGGLCQTLDPSNNNDLSNCAADIADAGSMSGELFQGKLEKLEYQCIKLACDSRKGKVK